MELFCLVGGALCILMMLFQALRSTIMFAILWILYLSVYKVKGSVVMLPLLQEALSALHTWFMDSDMGAHMHLAGVYRV